MSSLNASPGSPQPPEVRTLPLSRRTELRLQNMERFTERVASTSIGFDERSLAMENRVRAAAQYLVALLREREMEGL